MLPFSRSANSAAHATDVRSPGNTGLRQVGIPLAATAFLAMCAHISLPLPFTPIPVTMQTFAVLLIGMLLDPTLALTTMLLYLAEGAAGLPVFSPHGPGGLAQLFGPSAGYLLAYPPAALLAARTFAGGRRKLPTFVAGLVASLAADALILAAGAAWLGVFLRLSMRQAFSTGVLPFLAGETCKIALLALTVTALQRAASRK